MKKVIFIVILFISLACKKQEDPIIEKEQTPQSSFVATVDEQPYLGTMFSAQRTELLSVPSHMLHPLAYAHFDASIRPSQEERYPVIYFSAPAQVGTFSLTDNDRERDRYTRSAQLGLTRWIDDFYYTSRVDTGVVTITEIDFTYKGYVKGKLSFTGYNKKTNSRKTVKDAEFTLYFDN